MSGLNVERLMKELSDILSEKHGANVVLSAKRKEEKDVQVLSVRREVP